MPRAAITGWGSCVPPTVLSNADLEAMMDTSDEWITVRSGIKERRISHVEPSDMAAVASQHALAGADLTIEDIDLIVLASCTSNSIVPRYCGSCTSVAGCTGLHCCLRPERQLLGFCLFVDNRLQNDRIRDAFQSVGGRRRASQRPDRFHRPVHRGALR